MAASLCCPLPAVDRHDCVYTACYCEENVYCLLKDQPQGKGHWRWFAVFVSNPEQAVVVHHQRPGAGTDNSVVWDYHVMAVALPRSPTAHSCSSSSLCGSSPSLHAYVYDFDSTLPFPCALDDYVAQALAPRATGLQLSPPQLKWIPARAYLASFSSDRAHMRSPQGGWLSPPPSYKPIVQGACIVVSTSQSITHDHDKALWSLTSGAVARAKQFGAVH